MKVACEQIVLDGAASAMVIRPGLIVGPDDPTGRFTLLAAPARGRRRGARPGRPDDVDAGRRRARPGGLDRRLRASSGPPASTTASGVHADGRPAAASAPRASMPSRRCTWVDQDFLTEQERRALDGTGCLPLWLPRPGSTTAWAPTTPALPRRGTGRPPARGDRPRHPGLARSHSRRARLRDRPRPRKGAARRLAWPHGGIVACRAAAGPTSSAELPRASGQRPRHCFASRVTAW